MRKRETGLTYLLAAVLIATIATGAVAAPAMAQGNILNQVLEVVGIGLVVKAFAPQINDFINTLMLNNRVENREKTKVVPILSVGIGISSPGGAYIGAAQVSGPEEAVAAVQAVAQIEATFSNTVRVKALVPIDSLTPLPGSFRRVDGVGVTAIIDVRI
jgi:hypothetical protein